MSDQQRQDEMIEALLREVHESAGPVDSWHALHGRIESRCHAVALPMKLSSGVALPSLRPHALL